MPPEPELIEAIATDLGVDPSFVEKDWYAIRLVAAIINIRQENPTLVFSGGTSLSKGYGLIQRFSEDLDFKVLLPEARLTRPARRDYRRGIVEAIRAENDWTLEDDDVEVRNDHRFFRCQIAYPTRFNVLPALRPRLQLEVTFASPALAPEECSLRSFVADARQEQAEVPQINCVAPAETAADKISALTWRVLDQRTRNDPTLIRHVYDLAALEPLAAAHQGFPGLLRRLLDADATRGATNPDLEALTPVERLAVAFDSLTDQEHAANYGDFVREMCYGTENETPTYQDGLDAIRRLGQRLE